MRLTIVGCGDAFGSGGRGNTCFHVATRNARFLIDCGATALPALKALALDRNDISFILITHFHLDHFGGIPPFILDAQFFSKRTAPLTIFGPPGLAKWYARYMETAFPGSSTVKRKFDLDLTELEAGAEIAMGDAKITPQLARHGPPPDTFFGYRISADDRVLAYTGDTEWTQDICTLGHNADLLIAEAYFYDKQIPMHLDYKTLSSRLAEIGAKRVLLTHMNEDMLAHAPDVPEETASDGLVLEL